MFIRNAKVTDYYKITNFIDLNWKKNHILCKNKKVFNHYYRISKTKLGFILAKDHDEIIGLIGYINNKKFNQKIDKDVIWLTMWCTKKNTTTLAGLKLLDFIEKYFSYNIISSLGVNENVLHIYQRFGFKIGKVNHYYIKNRFKFVQSKHNNWTLKKGLFKGNLTNDNYAKNYTYLINKYTRSRFYKYYNFSVYYKKKPVCNIVTRKMISKEYKNTILRIIDFSGDIKALQYFAILVFEDKSFGNMQYIDILLQSFDNRKFKGFTKTSKSNYLPIYFEPLIKKYSEKNFIYKINKNSVNNNFIIVTGDCDQDRPNR